MAPRKRRKVYLDPGSSSSMPKSTKWLLHHPLGAAPRTPKGHKSPMTSTRSPTSPANSLEDQICDESTYTDLTREKDSDEDCSDFSDGEHPTSDASFSQPVSAKEDCLPGENSACPSGDPKHIDADELCEPFIEGGTVTRGDAYMLLLDLAIKFGLSWAAIEDIQKLFNNLFEKKCFPESKYLFKNFCGIDMKDVIFNFYCADYKHLLAKTTGCLELRQKLEVKCTVCNTKYVGRDLVRTGSFFVTLPIEKQLMAILSSKTANSALAANLSRPQSSNGLMTDILDGHQYRTAREKVGMATHDLTLTVNSDGSPVLKSSKYSIWPVQIILNELPPRLRWSNVMAPLLWYGHQHPNMPMLLQAFVHQLEQLNATGITWTLAGTQVRSKVFCICCCADAPARAAMQQMVQFNGYFGCSWCYHPGTNVQGRSEERCSFGVNDAGVFVSTSIAFSEALDDREPGADTRVSGLGVLFSLGTCGTTVCRAALDDGGVALAAATEGADGVATGPLTVTSVDS
ncbi:uncharacterized protein [Dermacentor albipictus]|uniref:uncharacterized protein n=1 Tax=Dermacentor albipictus TaxID=60249 RepID=UPI0038FD1230